jgi:putative ABC transport system permease protein
MKSLAAADLRIGLDSIRGSKLRNFWMMFGIIVGVAAVIIVVSVGNGIKQQISSQIHSFPKDLIAIQPQKLISSKSSNFNLLSSNLITGSLGNKDYETITGISGIGAVAPLSATPGTVSADNGVYNSGLVIGTSPDFPSLVNQSLAYGIFFGKQDLTSNFAILGQDAADRMFKNKVPIGRTFIFRGQEFSVVGIFNQFDSAPLSPSTNFNSAIFIPIDVAQSLTNNSTTTFEILAKSLELGQTSKIISAIYDSLRAAHNGQTDFTATRQYQNLSSNNHILDLITQLIAGAAAISLLVGGIGIMNVMLVSVSERMHEIGIRKAIGATDRQILSQFMIEAAYLSFKGGVIGIVLAYIVVMGIKLITNLKPDLNWKVALVAGIGSLLLGIFFGTFPALKAARKNPIDALRAN